MKYSLSNDYYLLVDRDLLIQNFSDNVASVWVKQYTGNLKKGRDLKPLIPAEIRNDVINLHKNCLIYGEHLCFEHMLIISKDKAAHISVTLSPVRIDKVKQYVQITIKNQMTDHSSMFDPKDALSKYAFFTSHRLRGPLTNIMSIAGNLNSLKDSEYEISQLKDLLKDIRDQAEILDQTIYTLNGLITKDIGQSQQRELSGQIIGTIFLIDDDPFVNKLHEKMIHNNWPHILVKSYINGENALNDLSKYTPQLIMLDINMPGINGWQVLNALEYADTDVDVIMLSSSIDPTEREKAFGFKNVKHFLTKPLLSPQLDSILPKD